MEEGTEELKEELAKAVISNPEDILSRRYLEALIVPESFEEWYRRVIVKVTELFK